MLIDCRFTSIAEKTVYEYYKRVPPEQNAVCGETVLDSHCPFGIAYNVLISGKTAFANLPYTDSVPKQELMNRNFHPIHVKRGYANCTVYSKKGMPIDDIQNVPSAQLSV